MFCVKVEQDRPSPKLLAFPGLVGALFYRVASGMSPQWTKHGWRDTETAASAFSPSALWSQLVPVWKPELFQDPSQETSTSNIVTRSVLI